MLDLNKSFVLIRDGLLEPAKTWEAYKAENRDWQQTALLLTGPLVVGAAVLSAILSWMFRSQYLFSQRPGFFGMLLGLVFAVIALALAAFIFSYLAGVFQGKHDFNRGLVAISFAAIPGYLGSVIGTLPWIGLLLAFAASIVSLVYLYRIIPVYLEVPAEKRVPHFAVSLLATLVAMFIIGTILGLGSVDTRSIRAVHERGEGSPAEYGMMGGIGQQAELMAQAEQDRYQPPEDGRVREGQMEAYVDTLRKMADLRARQAANLQELNKKMEGGKEPGLADIGAFTSGMNSMMSLANAEMEVVKSKGGNWAEHLWVRNQLRTAYVQKDLNDAVKHNYALYMEHEAKLKEFNAAY